MPQIRQILTLDPDDITTLQAALAGKAVEKVVAGVRADLKASTVEPKHLAGDLDAGALAGLARRVELRRETLVQLDTDAARELLPALDRASEVVAAAVTMLPPDTDPQPEHDAQPGQHDEQQPEQSPAWS